jgi:fumarylacetoacetase
MDALEPFRVSSPKQDPSPLPYLQQKESILLIFTLKLQFQKTKHLL